MSRVREHEAEVVALEALAASRDASLEMRARDLEARAAKLVELQAALEAARPRDDARLVALEGASGTSASALLQDHVAERVTAAQQEAQRAAHAYDVTLRDTASQGGRRVMATILERYDGVGHLERVQNTLPVPPAVAAAYVEGACGSLFAELTGCALSLADEGLTVRGDDPLAREVARRVVREVAKRSIVAVDTLRDVAERHKDEINREVSNAGKRACNVLGVEGLHPEIQQLVGRLKFRLSYSQNQWKHAIEVAHLAGMMASELGLDVSLARRGGLLHDIGKAMTHDHEGGHAVLGAQVARRCGEAEVVANCIGSHHNDEPMQTPLAFIVTAADALSGARPGARRESVTQYMERIHDIQRIAARSPEVLRVDIMQAGREVRVTVAGSESGALEVPRQGMADADIHPLAQRIARAIEEELTFAGQIRVTVIKESRAVSIAK